MLDVVVFFDKTIGYTLVRKLSKSVYGEEGKYCRNLCQESNLICLMLLTH